MPRIILLLCLLFCQCPAYSQDSTGNLLRSRRTSYYTYVFRISPDQARAIYRKDLHVVTDAYFHTVVDSFPTGHEYDEQKLPIGHYLFTHASGDRLDYELQSVSALAIKVLNNQVDLAVWIADSLGNTIPDAQVHLRGRSLPYDAKTRTYRFRKTNRRGLLAITYQGSTAYHLVDARYKNSWAKRTGLRIVHYSGLGYLIKPFKDLFYSVKYHHPTGWILKLVNGLTAPEYRETNAKGYLVFNKPMYQPGDTVRFKAFVVNKRGKPLGQTLDVNLNIIGKPKTLAQRSPYRKGGYSYEFPLTDSLGLKLNRSYPIFLVDHQSHRVYLSGSFQYEDYELKANTFKLRSEKKTHYLGTRNALYAKGTDENDLNLLDAKVQLTVRPRAVRNYRTPTMFVPDTLWQHEQALDAVGETQLVLPDSIFPAVSLDYDVEAVFLTSNNERHTETLTLTYEYAPAEIRVELRQDTLVATYLVAGKTQSAQALLTAYADKEEEKVLSEQTIRLPYKGKINPLAYSYEVETDDQLENLTVREESALVACFANRTADSVFFQVTNPRHLPFWYTIYRKSRQLKRGMGTSLDFKAKTTTSQLYFVSLQYVWGGQVTEEESRIPFSTRQLNIRIDQPAVVYPGQKTRVNIAVTDALGKPAPNVDLTAYGFTKKFPYAFPPTLPDFDRHRRGRHSLNKFVVRDKFGDDPNGYSDDDTEPDADQKLNWARWRKEMGLDSLAYYHFLYPDQGVFSQYIPTKDQTAQFAPFVVRKGELLSACLIYLDSKPIYYKDADVEQRYSFRTEPGKHFLQIRTAHQLITYPDLLIKAGQKLILSLDIAQPHPLVKIDSASAKFTDREQVLLHEYALYVRPQAGEDLAYLRQGSFVQLLNRESASYYRSWPLIAGLFAPTMTHLVWKGHFNNSFIFEPGFEYEFQEGLIRQRSLNYAHFYKFSLRPDQRLAPDFGAQATTETEADSVWRRQREEKESRQRTYNNPETTGYGFGKLAINGQAIPVRPVRNVLLFRPDDPNFLRVYGGGTTTFHQLQPGRYQLVFLLYFNEYVTYDSVDVLPNGTNYLRLPEKAVHPPDDFSRKASEAIGKVSYIFKNTLQDIKEQYNRTYNVDYPLNAPSGRFTHLVEGQVVAGDDQSPLPGVSVNVKGSTVGTVTDAHGYYRLYAPPNGVLVFSFIGYVAEELLIASHAVVEAKLQSDIKSLSEVVVVGYGVQRRSNLAASVSVVESGFVQGKAAGVVIRGTGSLGGGEPLLIVDGMPFSGRSSDLDPATIANAQVLKSETAVALYGSRASNGVLFITTHQGKAAAQKTGATDLLQTMAQGSSLRSRFSDYAYWQPRLTTDQAGLSSFEVTFPDDLTNWKTFVLAMDDRKRTGMAETSVKAFRPLTGNLSVPRFLVRGDTTQAVGKTLNYTLDTVSVTTAFEVDGKSTQLRSDRVARSLLDSLLLTTSTADSVQIKYAVSKADGYLDGEKRFIPVVPLGTLETKGVFLNLDRDTTLTLPFDPALGRVQFYADADALPLMLSELDHVRRYEYGCNEQTASKLKALLLEKKVRTYLKQPFPYEREIPKLIKKLEDSQRKEGTWGWWPDLPFSTWITRHVAEALLMANQEGYSTHFEPRTLTDYFMYEMEGYRRAEKIQILRLLQTLGAKVDYQRYAAALEKDTTLNLQSRLELTELEQNAGLPYSLETLFKHQQENITGHLFWGKEQYYLEDNAITNTLLAYRILRQKGGYEEHLRRIRRYLLEKRQSGYWRNTYESVQILEAILPDLMEGSVIVQPSRLRLSGAINDTVSVFPYRASFSADKRLLIRKEGKLPVYLTAFQQFRNPAPSKVEKDFVVMTYFENRLTILKAGQPVKLVVEVEVRRDADYVMVEVPIPAGCSYENQRIHYGLEAYREYFRHKTSIFCQHLRKGKYAFTVELLPRYNGTYTLNPAKAELMYYPVFFGRNEIRKVRVK